jgi:hypothetical protein
MANGRILVIAPQFDMRRSLEFVLDAEGFEVISRSRIDFSNPAAEFSIRLHSPDHKHWPARRNSYRFLHQGCAGRPGLEQTDRVAVGSVKDLVEKPVMGGAIVSSVRRVLALRTSVPTKETS